MENLSRRKMFTAFSLGNLEMLLLTSCELYDDLVLMRQAHSILDRHSIAKRRLTRFAALSIETS